MNYYDDFEKLFINYNVSVDGRFEELDGGMTYKVYVSNMELWITLSQKNHRTAVVRAPVNLYYLKTEEGVGLVGPLAAEQEPDVHKWVDKYNNQFYGIKVFFDTRDSERRMPVIYLALELIIFRKEQIAMVFTDQLALLRNAVNTIAAAVHSNAQEI